MTAKTVKVSAGWLEAVVASAEQVREMVERMDGCPWCQHDWSKHSDVVTHDDECALLDLIEAVLA